jgi:hypothetical protein
MEHAARTLIAAMAITSLASGQAQLALQGEPYFDGDMTLSVVDTSSAGEAIWLALGINPLPLDTPLITGKGPWYIGLLTHTLLLGTVPVDGVYKLDFTMPPETPALVGIPLVLQGFVNGLLTNPATLPLDQPYMLPSNAVVIDHPLPSPQALFGDSTAAGDFNDDGVMDLAVGAWFEDVGGIDKAGRVYIMWGPDFTAYTQLESVSPAHLRHFGQGLLATDFDGDGIDDLAVGEGVGGDPPTVGVAGHIYIFSGSRVLSTAPSMVITSAGTGQEAYVFGRLMRVGDINGDELPDIVVCAPDATVQGFAKAGRLEVFYGPGYGSAQLIENPEPKTNDFFGSRVSLADVTGDGVADVVEASGRAKVGSVAQAGRLHLYDGPTLALLQTIDNPSPAAGDRFGEGLIAADLDADDAAEVIAADVRNNFYVVWNPLEGSPIGTWMKPPSPNPIPGATSFGYFFSATDVNDDGSLDIAIADPFEGDTVGCFVGGGTVYVALAPYYSTYVRFTNPDSACGDDFSWNLIAADLDGDGVDELIAGDDTSDIGGVSNVGRVVIVKP